MELTPIKIPGKRRRKAEPPLRWTSNTAKGKLPGKNKKKKTAPKIRASYLEKELPLEIVERIFWMSENVNFPRSGLRVGLLLSGESTRRKTFIQAFGPTWDLWFGSFIDGSASLQTHKNRKDDPHRAGGNPDFQSAILRYDWAHIDFILDCLDSWAQKHAKNMFFQHQKLWGDPPTDNKLDDDPGGINNFKSARQYFQHDFDAFCAHADVPLNHNFSLIEVHGQTQIPDSLLTGPWDDAALKKLFWLIRAGARLSADQTWEVTLEGYHNALSTETNPPTGSINVPAVRLILMLGGNHWPEHIAEDEFERLQSLEKSLRSLQSKLRIDAYHRYASVASILSHSYSEQLERGVSGARGSSRTRRSPDMARIFTVYDDQD